MVRGLRRLTATVSSARCHILSHRCNSSSRSCHRSSLASCAPCLPPSPSSTCICATCRRRRLRFRSCLSSATCPICSRPPCASAVLLARPFLCPSCPPFPLSSFPPFLSPSLPLSPSLSLSLSTPLPPSHTPRAWRREQSWACSRCKLSCTANTAWDVGAYNARECLNP